MAESEQDIPEEDLENYEFDPGARKGLPMKKIGILVLSVALGSTLGLKVVAPRISAQGTEAVADDSHGEEDDSHGGGHGGGGHGGGGHGGGGSDLIEISNLIVNPAGTDGMRFVMATVALDVADRSVREHLIEVELQVRDHVASVLERQTMDMLTAPGARDSLRALMRHALSSFVPDGTHISVYLPHFVIQ